MLPTLKDGDKVLVKPGSHFEVGDIVLANHPYKKMRVIKRISEISDGRVSLVGDNPDESTDSRTFGEVSSNDILGRVIAKR